MSLEKLKKDTFNQMCNRGEIATNSDNEDWVNKLIQIGYDYKVKEDIEQDKRIKESIKQIVKVKVNHSHERRHNLTTCFPSELSIKKAMSEIEKLGADDEITKALMLLTDAHLVVSDYIDNLLSEKK